MREGRSISKVVKQSLQLRGIKPIKAARLLVERARSRAGRSEAEALEIGENEVRQARHVPERYIRE